MANINKTIDKLKNMSGSFTYKEFEKVMKHYGYREIKTGKTSGSRVKFVNDEMHVIIIHKPHPGNTLHKYQMKDLKDRLNL